MYKQVIVVRTDLGMSQGKIAAQVAHASIQAWKNAKDVPKKGWEQSGMKKVVLRAGSEQELTNIYEHARKMKLPASLIKDAGMTEIPAGTITCVGIGPASEDTIDVVTGKLSLLE